MHSSSQIYLKAIYRLSSRTSYILFKNYKKKKNIKVISRKLNVCIVSKFTPLKRPINFLILSAFSELVFNVVIYNCLKKSKVINLSSTLLLQNTPYFLSRKSALLK